MSRLVLIRHGQTAGFPGGSYTELTPAGVAQAERLGRWMAQRPRPGRVFVGPRERQQQTAALIGGEAGWPEPVMLPELDEHSGREVFEHALARFAAGDPAAAFLDGWDQDERSMLRGFRRALSAWARGELSPDCEPWSAVMARAAAAVAAMTDGANSTVVAVTSAGWIGAAVGGAVGASALTAMELSYAVYNTSVSELWVRGGAPSLWCFNTTPHLDDALITPL